jgi:hypothetical protein
MWGLLLSGLTIAVSLLTEKKAEGTAAKIDSMQLRFGCNRMFLSGTGKLDLTTAYGC